MSGVTTAGEVRPARIRSRGKDRHEPALASLEQSSHRRSRWQWVSTISPLVWFFLLVLALFVVAAVFADLIAPYDPTHNVLMARLQAPSLSDAGSGTHLLGTDQLGRDVLSRIIHGARVSLTIAVLGTLLGAAFGTLCGLVSGFTRGRVDEFVMLLVDAYVALPFLIIALSIVAMLGSSMRVLVMLAALAGWASYTRVSRGLALQTRNQQYVLAARARSGPAAAASHSAERDRAPDRPGDLRADRDHPARILALLPRLRHPTTSASLGRDGRRGPRLPRHRLVDRGLPWPGDHAGRDFGQPDRRLAAGRARPHSTIPTLTT